MRFVFSYVLLLCFKFAVLSSNRLLEPFFVGSNSVRIDRLGLGTAGLQQDTKLVARAAYSLGVGLFDTAEAMEWYREDLLGLAFYEAKFPINNVSFISKIHPRNFKSILSSVEASSMRLHKRPLDVVLLHAPADWDRSNPVNWQLAWKDLENMVRNGLVKAIGVSNFDTVDLNDLVFKTSTGDVQISIVQNWMDPFHQDREVRQICRDQGIVYMAYSTLGSQWRFNSTQDKVLGNSVIVDIAKQYNTSSASVVLSWALQNDVVVIPRSGKLKHIAENFKLLVDCQANEQCYNYRRVSTFLDDESMKRIDGLDEG